MTMEDMKSFYQFSVLIEKEIQGLFGKINSLEEQLKTSKSGECVACSKEIK